MAIKCDHEKGQERKLSLETDPGRGIISMLKHLVDNVNNRHEHMGISAEKWKLLKETNRKTGSKNYTGNEEFT